MAATSSSGEGKMDTKTTASASRRRRPSKTSLCPGPEASSGLFLTEHERHVLLSARRLFEGALGPLPLLLSLTTGYYMDSTQPLTFLYENDEILFAYKQDMQFRVLLQDSCQRTLSLPVHSALTFCVQDGSPKEVTLPQILSQHCLPVTLRFAQPGDLSFVVDKHMTDHSYFGPLLLTAVYDELFFWCLSIDPYGRIRRTPRVLPRNLLDVTFTPVTGIRGASDPEAKLKEFMAKFSHFAHSVRCNTDPFFQDLAIVSHGPEPVDRVMPYIDENTFVTVLHRAQSPDPHPHRTMTRDSLYGSDPAISFRSKVHQEPPSSNSAERLYEEPLTLHRALTTARAKHAAALFTKPEELHPPDAEPRSLCENDDDDDTDSGNASSDHPLRSRSLPPPPLPRPRLRAEGSGSDDDVRRQQGKRKPSPCTLPRAVPATMGPGSGVEYSPLTMAAPSPPPDSWQAALADLSVEDLALSLKQLGLSKHRKKFRAARIDGVLLQKLSEDTLRKEFGMQQLELIRLNAFISEGHVPKRLVKKATSWRASSPAD